MIAPLIAKTLRPGPNQAPDVAIGLAEAGHEAFFSRFRIAQTSGQVYLEQNLMPELILRSICLQLPQNLPKTSKNVAKFSEKKKLFFFQKNFDDFFFAESIRMYPNVSEYVKTSPKRPENVEKLRENVEKLRERLFPRYHYEPARTKREKQAEG